VFTAEPLDRGYGTTLGNSLRRILLSSIGGAAITTVKIEGVDHEFSTLEGIKEDVLDIIANIKNIAVKSYSDATIEMTLSAKGEGVVTARDIKHDNEVEIINPSHHIATIGKGGKLNITFTVEKGVGYIMADVNESKKHPIGTMPIDASFSPVVKVNHKVEPARVGKSLDYDRLTLDVWTNGVISPEEAVKQSSKILKDQMDIFLKLNEKPTETENIRDAEVNKQKNSGLSLTIDDLELSARSSNCLKKANINTVAELVDKPLEDLLKIKNFGKKSAEEINTKLAQYNLALKGDINDIALEEDDE
jgi:DNA-directed RNA polymerase subunit alpha